MQFKMEKTPIVAGEFGVVNSKNIFSAVMYEYAVLKLIETKAGRDLLADSKEEDGTSALHAAVMLHQHVADQLTSTKGGIKFLAANRDEDGWSALEDAVSYNPATASRIMKDSDVRALFRILRGQRTRDMTSMLDYAIKEYE
jgi:hypothetical protein